MQGNDRSLAARAAWLSFIGGYTQEEIAQTLKPVFSGLADDVLSAVAAMGGTISAEHGVGVAKSPWLHLVRSPAELAVLAAVKRALDPNGILNPGVLTPPT